MLVILSALGGLLESDPREVNMTTDRYQVPVLDMELEYWKKAGVRDTIYASIATFEHRGKYRRVGDQTAMILELVDYPPKQTEGSPNR